MRRYAINDEILFQIDLQFAKKLYNRHRRVEKRKFKNSMRDTAKYVNPIRQRRKYGRGRK